MTAKERIKAIRGLTRLTQAKFCEKYQIPTRTLEKWEVGGAKPPEYVILALSKWVESDLAKEDGAQP